LLEDLVQDCIEEGMDRRSLQGMLPSLLIATAQSSRMPLTLPIPDLVSEALRIFDEAQPKVDADDVLDDFDVNIDADEIVLDWGDGAGVFGNLLDADDVERLDKACGKGFIEESDQCSKTPIARSPDLERTIEKGRSLFSEDDLRHLDDASNLEKAIKDFGTTSN
jgi:hypothetical protein